MDHVAGKTIISDEVFIELARTAMHKVNEVFREEKKGTFAELTQMVSERFVPQVAVKKTPADDGDDTNMGSVMFELKITLLYGVRIPEVIKKVRDIVVAEVEDFTGYQVERIDIIIEKLVKSEKKDDVETVD